MMQTGNKIKAFIFLNSASTHPISLFSFLKNEIIGGYTGVGVGCMQGGTARRCVEV